MPAKPVQHGRGGGSIGNHPQNTMHHNHHHNNASPAPRGRGSAPPPQGQGYGRGGGAGGGGGGMAGFTRGGRGGHGAGPSHHHHHHHQHQHQHHHARAALPQAPPMAVPSVSVDSNNVSRDAFKSLCDVLRRFRLQADQREAARAEQCKATAAAMKASAPPMPQPGVVYMSAPQLMAPQVVYQPQNAQMLTQLAGLQLHGGQMPQIVTMQGGVQTASGAATPSPSKAQSVATPNPEPKASPATKAAQRTAGGHGSSDSPGASETAGNAAGPASSAPATASRPVLTAEPLASVFGLGGSDDAWGPEAKAGSSQAKPVAPEPEAAPAPVFGTPIRAGSGGPPLPASVAPEPLPAPEPAKPPLNIFVVDSTLSQVWRSVVNPADPAQAASNLGRLLQAERAMQVAAEFLSMPGHVEVLRRVSEAAASEHASSRRSRLAHHVLAALLRRLSPSFRAFAPCLVALEAPDAHQDAIDAAAAPETLGCLIAADILDHDALTKCISVLIENEATETAAVQVLWFAAKAIHHQHNEDKLADAASIVTPAEPLLAFLEDLVWKHIAPTSHTGLRLAKALGWTRKIPGGKPALESIGTVMKPMVRICVAAGAARSIDGVDRCAYSSAADTLFTVGGPSGIACFDPRTIQNGVSNDGVCKPRSLFSDKRFVAIDVGTKRDVLLAVTGPPDAPSVHSVDLKAMVKAGGPPAAGKPQTGVQGWQHSFSVIDANCATAIKSVGYRAAACCVAVEAETQFSLRLYTATGVADRTIAAAHADYVTCLATSADNDNLVFSGARDGTVKSWDLRGNQARATAMKGGHIATVSGISVARDVVLTTGLDGRACLWDVRKLSQPMSSLTFDGPVLSCATHAGRGFGVVATMHQLSVLALHPFVVKDSVPGAYASATFGGTGGAAIFAVPVPPSISKGVVHGFRIADYFTPAEW